MFRIGQLSNARTVSRINTSTKDSPPSFLNVELMSNFKKEFSSEVMSNARLYIFYHYCLNLNC